MWRGQENSYHVHDGQQEPLSRLGTMVTHHVRIGHHHCLHSVRLLQTDGVPLASSLVSHT